MRQLQMFDNPTEDVKIDDSGNSLVRVNGLTYIPNFITDNDHRKLLLAIDGEMWLHDLKRRVQHYGYKYDYKKRQLDQSMFLGPLPKWADVVAEKIFRTGLMNLYPDQVIVNEYLPGQGIADHVDCEPCFGQEIVSLSLISPCVMDIKEKGNKANRYQIILPPKSLLALSGEARYNWSHGIQGRISDVFNGIPFTRARRVSLTFRKVIFS